jgi:putative spermidine/putrescine transport system ATP-binding protein
MSKAKIDVNSNIATPSIPAVRFEGATRAFGSVKAVDDVTLDIRAGEFFAMLGPSGSGKTTCLRLIAGFEQPTSGHIEIFGETAEGVPPYRRNVNTVFQDYALFPHMNVRDNVAYGLMVKGMERAARMKKAEEALSLVALAGYGERRPGQLSGGQRQRVALARALVNEPKVLLLDEPLGALDLKLREQMQVELKSLQRSLGITFVFVTHDQGEALSMADRVAVFNNGKIAQVDAPMDIYERPRTRFVADFVGSANVLSPDQTAKLGGPRRWASLRPEKLRILKKAEKPAAGEASIAAHILSHHYQGASTRLHVQTEDGLSLHALVPASNATAGETLRLAWPKAAMQVMEGEA